MDVPETVQQGTAARGGAQQVLASDVLSAEGGVEDGGGGTVGEEDVDCWVRGDGGLGWVLRGGGGGACWRGWVEAVFGPVVGEGPAAVFGLVGGGVDLDTVTVVSSSPAAVVSNARVEGWVVASRAVKLAPFCSENVCVPSSR